MGDLPYLLRSPASSRGQLPQEEVRSQQSAAPQEEAEIIELPPKKAKKQQRGVICYSLIFSLGNQYFQCCLWGKGGPQHSCRGKKQVDSVQRYYLRQSLQR